MKNVDINLFKAAGGEKAKTAKRPITTYLALLLVIIMVAGGGTLAFFNSKLAAMNNELDNKKALSNSYDDTILYAGSMSLEYLEVIANIEAASAINKYNNATMKLFPNATDGEVAAIKNTVINNPSGQSYDFNDVVEGVRFTAWDYPGIRDTLDSTVENYVLFRFAIDSLGKDQNASRATNVWYTYYRGYFAMMFKGGNDGLGLDSLAKNLNSSYAAMNEENPFMSLILDSVDYSAIKYTTIVYQDVTYNLMLCPMKSVVERAMDVIEATAQQIIEDNGWYSSSQREFAKYAITNFNFNNESMSFSLILDQSISVSTTYFSALDASAFFEVDNDVIDVVGEVKGGKKTYNVVLNYKGTYRGY